MSADIEQSGQQLTVQPEELPTIDIVISDLKNVTNCVLNTLYGTQGRPEENSDILTKTSLPKNVIIMCFHSKNNFSEHL